MFGRTLAVSGDCDWLAAYKAANKDTLKRAPEFAAWLESGGYVPIAGGWQY